MNAPIYTAFRLALFVLALILTTAVWADDEPASTLVFLVRHAEKVDSSRDPELSAAGSERAKELANMLRSAGLEHVHSTDFIRTRDTAAPTAAAQSLEIELYNGRDLAALAKKIRAAGGRHLVVGHSNTTPEMVELLGGDAGPPIREKDEYDRLYVLTIAKNGEVESVLLRY